MRIIQLISIYLIFLTSCNGGGDKDTLIIIKTSFGEMKAVLHDQTPKHKENFIKLVKSGFYDSLIFHRVIEGFMIQGGDPDSRNAKPGQPLGSGGPGYTIPAEFNRSLIHKKGALSAARMGDNQNPQKESSGSQFYIVQGKKYTNAELTTDLNKLASSIGNYLESTGDTILRNELINLYQTNQDAYLEKLMSLKPTMETALGTTFSRDFSADRVEVYTTTGGVPHLDDGYTVFGKVVEGLEIIDKIASQSTDSRDRPLQDIIMEINLEEVPKKEITEKYGYQYALESN
ncbi:MAG: peptidylprolyl isomerase [Bacteroidetes bacterium]|nr:peptidylprolyl isomerase [Bacteroidota bacterium]MDA1119242.1 peptidylprolyl isomerase [Bacteroidota bacterium]